MSIIERYKEKYKDEVPGVDKDCLTPEIARKVITCQSNLSLIEHNTTALKGYIKSYEDALMAGENLLAKNSLEDAVLVAHYMVEQVLSTWDILNTLLDENKAEKEPVLEDFI